MENCTDTNGTDCCKEGVGSIAECNETRVYSSFDYIGSLTSEQQARCEVIRASCNNLREVLVSLPACKTRTFSDRCISEALTNLEYCCMFAIKAVAFEGKQVA